MAYSRLEPFGEERADLRSALVAQTVANSLRGHKEPYKLADFLLSFGEERPDVDPVMAAEDMRVKFRAIAKKKPKEGDGSHTRHSAGRPRRR